MTDLRTSSPVLVIDSLSKDDEGTYSCLASSSAGQVEERLQVMVTDTAERASPNYRRTPASQHPTHHQESSRVNPRDHQQSRYPPTIGYQFEFQDYDQEPPEKEIGLVEHEVNTREGLIRS